MASYLNNYLRGIGAGGFMKDYRHASTLYASANYRLSPKFKFLYHCVFVFNRVAKSLNYRDSEVGFMVKSTDLPGVSFDVEEIKQYNRKSYNYTGVAYNPVSMVFHDDNANNVRNFLSNIYNYYTSDGSKAEGAYSIRTAGVKDTFLDESSTASQKWGIDADHAQRGEPLLKEIQIYSLSKGVGSRYTLKNPIVTQFAHGSHAQADGAMPQESSISVSYDSYTYADVNVASIPNFGSVYDRLSGSTSSGLAIESNGLIQTLRGALDAVPDRNPYDILSTAAQTAAQIEAFDNRNRLYSTFTDNLPSTVEQIAKNATSVFPTATVKKAREILNGILG